MTTGGASMITDQEASSACGALCRRRRAAPSRARVLSVIAAIALSATAAFAGSSTTGRGEFVVCQSCHGSVGEGNQALEAPRIAGLDAKYVVRQLDDFRQGRRGAEPSDITGAQMAAMAATLADAAAVERVAAYVAALPDAQPSPTVSGDLNAGRLLFATCAACHAPQGEGDASHGAPRLAGMSDWYLLRQLEAYRAGRRGRNPGDATGAAMQAIAATLPTKAALLDVVVYINSLGRPAVTQSRQ